MSLRDGDLVICRVCGKLSFYRGYTTCPICYGKPLVKVEKQNKEAIEEAMERRSHKEAAEQ